MTIVLTSILDHLFEVVIALGVLTVLAVACLGVLSVCVFLAVFFAQTTLSMRPRDRADGTWPAPRWSDMGYAGPDEPRRQPGDPVADQEEFGGDDVAGVS